MLLLEPEFERGNATTASFSAADKYAVIMRVLLTGGAGYIGSHTALVLLEQGHEVAVLDDLSNGSVEALRRVEELTERSLEFVQGDLTDAQVTHDALEQFRPEAVIHLAGLKAVGESVERPLYYYQTNLTSTLNLLHSMQALGVEKLIFSSSATVYGDPQWLPITEAHPVGIGIQNPYGWTKYMNEQIIRDTTGAWPALAVVNLRYFNPVGAHSSGRIGEDPSGPPNNLLPFISQVAAGVRPQLAVFGNDYDTPDGTGVRDYIHVMDLAAGHVDALSVATPGIKTFNLGTGLGTSVLEAISTFEEASGQSIPCVVQPRRAGDVAVVVADPGLARTELGWQTQRTFFDACRDTWKWQSQNPSGYSSAT